MATLAQQDIGPDLSVLAAVVGAIVGTALVALLIPALRAARMDPQTALRFE
jgi:ABC-type lipoprotein release transport system permease subunit